MVTLNSWCLKKDGLHLWNDLIIDGVTLLLAIAGVDVGNRWWSHSCAVPRPLISQMIVQGIHATPLQMICRMFPTFLTQGNYFYPHLRLPVNESCSSNLRIQVEH